MNNNQDQMRKPLYKNWVKGGLAYKYLKIGLDGFTDNAVKEEHVRILEETRKKNINVCDQCKLDKLKPKHKKILDQQSSQYHCPFRQIRCNCLFNDKTDCPKGFCDEIHDEILTHHASTPPAPNWKNTHINEWYIEPWEIAKCFINAPGYIDKKTVSEIDIAGILHVFINNTRLQSYLDCQFNKDNVFSKTLQGRNQIFHSPSMELNLNDFATMTNDMIALIEDKKGLSQNENAQTAVENIKELKRRDIYITIQNEVDVFKDVTINETVDEKTLQYISQKQELQTKLIKQYQNEQVKTWISPLITRHNNVNINKVYVHPKMFIEDSVKDTLSFPVEKRVQTFHDIFCDIENDTSPEQEDIKQPKVTQHRCHDKLKNIYIIGEVGTGKSALCKMMIYSWCNSLTVKQSGVHINDNENSILGLHELSRYDFLFYVQLCMIPGNIDDVLEMVIHSMKGITSASEIESIFNKESERCLIIIDGLDEWSQQEHSQRSSRHIKTGIPLSNKINNATILTTSTPSAKGILNLKCSQYNRKIKLVGIEESELQNMAKHYMEAFDKGVPCNNATYIDFIKDLKATNISHPEKRPLLFQQLLYLYCTGKLPQKINKSITAIYINNVNTMFGWSEEKEFEAKDMEYVPVDVDCLNLPKTLQNFKRYFNNKAFVLRLGKLAYQTITSVTPSVEIERSTFKDCDIPYQPLLDSSKIFGLIVEENCPDTTVEKTQVSFAHISFRDFFAAIYFVSSHCHEDTFGKISELDTPIFLGLFKQYNSIEKILQLSVMLVMVCGLKPCLIEDISKTVHSIVLTDSNRIKYIGDLECGEMFNSGLKVIEEIQNLTLKMLSECHLTNPDEEQRISIVDIVLRNEVNLSLLNQIIPDTVHSLNIDRRLLNDNTVGVILRLNHVHTLAITNEKKTTIKPSKLLPNADSVIQAILYNEDLDLDLSRHKYLRNVTLDKCKHMFISSVSSDNVSSCEIHELVFSHLHFSMLTSLLSKEEVLTLTNIKCDEKGCKNHEINLCDNTMLHTFSLANCNYIFPIVSSNVALERISIRQCCLSHEQYENVICNIKQMTLLNKVEIDNLHCDNDCSGHNIDLGNQHYLETLCLINCRHVGFINIANNGIKTCTIRNCTFLHDQCLEIRRILTQSISLEKLELSHNTCSVVGCDKHGIDLSHNKQLQSVKFFDNCLYPYKLIIDCLQKVVSYVTRVHTTIPKILINAAALTEFKIEAVSKNALYNKLMNSALQTLISLKRFELCKVDIEDEALTITSRMKVLNYIKLWLVNMSQSTWRSFVNSLGKLSQNVEINTKEMIVATNDDIIPAIIYVKGNIGKFKVTQDPDFDFSFTSIGCGLKISEC